LKYAQRNEIALTECIKIDISCRSITLNQASGQSVMLLYKGEIAKAAEQKNKKKK
jgi:hypothetical protein